ncbi:hypothetical protein Pmar_PMAR028491 [Perkinsus marinus ATCC 50983]|uniref:Uncharacterized protein n=1 Tax=Perkinsus marinus (strain ATCC 50983 / TXsc) TaxID=423536 RepID=C5LMA0_PERM5|nr:hypothetical protein Pmar_PMAR028491 [Perkinsus marinus ATCC 50983]EER02112.1 hypothetical protein Pmar_PMAR028491 [Perkinsus marinus ATCC 50983]|eukprot:XP_002769394.1 hypothetical protein Pmar_PMAR028491 [Perkinsus marinus ATCC 50983]
MDIFPAIVQLRTMSWVPWALSSAMAFIAVTGVLFATTTTSGKESPEPLAVRRSARLRERKDLSGVDAALEEVQADPRARRTAINYLIVTMSIAMFMMVREE